MKRKAELSFITDFLSAAIVLVLVWGAVSLISTVVASYDFLDPVLADPSFDVYVANQ